MCVLLFLFGSLTSHFGPQERKCGHSCFLHYAFKVKLFNQFFKTKMAMKFLHAINVPFFKGASADTNNIPYLEKTAKKGALTLFIFISSKVVSSKALFHCPPANWLNLCIMQSCRKGFSRISTSILNCNIIFKNNQCQYIYFQGSLVQTVLGTYKSSSAHVY